jgi:hypothetical protein
LIAAEDVAGVGVLGDEAQGLALSTAADEHERVGSTERCRRVERAFEPVVPPLETARPPDSTSSVEMAFANQPGSR